MSDVVDFLNQSLVAIPDLDPPRIERLLDVALDIKDKPMDSLRGRQVALLFYENSTRTYNSFVTAIHQLGATTCGFSSVAGTSVSKGESLHDTIKMFEAYSDAIVLRHPKDGAARWAADISKVPIFNAGDGKNQHPTQTLLDLYAIRQTQGRLSDLTVALVGDLKYGRTVHSLADALSMYSGNRLVLVSPKNLKLPPHSVNELKQRGVEVIVHDNFNEVLEKVDIVYMTRIQRERLPDDMEYEKAKGTYRLTASMLRGVKDTLKVLHPLPRVDEICPSVDATPYAHYFQQAAGGVDVRKALIHLTLLGEPRL